MQGIAQAWLVLELTHSGTALGIVTALQFLPILVFGPGGGLIADRFSKRKLLYLTQSSAGILAIFEDSDDGTHTGRCPYCPACQTCRDCG